MDPPTHGTTDTWIKRRMDQTEDGSANPLNFTDIGSNEPIDPLDLDDHSDDSPINPLI